MNDRIKRVEECFKQDVTQHRMRVIREDGVYRHVRFSRPDTGNHSFSLVTWPGFLAYTGDMGEYLFSRLEDMFEFFRQPLDHDISYGYWAEKCKAGDRTGSRDGDGVHEFSEALFREAVEEDFARFLEDNPDSCVDASEERGRLEDEVLSCSNEGMIRAFDAAVEFRIGNQPVFPDFWEHDCRDYTSRFLWCCNAIRWGVDQYYKSKEAPCLTT